MGPWGPKCRTARLNGKRVYVQSYLEVLFGSHRFIVIAGFTDIHKNDEGFLITEWIPNRFKCPRLFLKAMGLKYKKSVGFPPCLCLWS